MPDKTTKPRSLKLLVGGVSKSTADAKGNRDIDLNHTVLSTLQIDNVMPDDHILLGGHPAFQITYHGEFGIFSYDDEFQSG